MAGPGRYAIKISLPGESLFSFVCLLALQKLNEPTNSGKRGGFSCNWEFRAKLRFLSVQKNQNGKESLPIAESEGPSPPSLVPNKQVSLLSEISKTSLSFCLWWGRNKAVKPKQHPEGDQLQVFT